MKVLGLTGGIGSGKSAATDLFVSLGIPVIDADQVARDVVLPGEPALQLIAAHFGPQAIQADGHLNRRQLRDWVFAEPQQRQWLEQLLHPLIRQRIEARIATFRSNPDAPYLLLASPLLLETDQHRLTDGVIVVDVPESLQIARTQSRDDMTEEGVRRILAAQSSRQSRLDRADWILDNSGDLAALQREVHALHKQLSHP
ncbi:dephospho-CoA kinase [Nitrincola alkalilacustris]|uniref:dephospho-CoA kinase n=1 Tax=Nitrincola alkalilacustris TaxID=1571224 RepID=UPI00124C4910|nr:dephospho-CoA kinase [Nitrincola alkalilacustris]